MNRSLYIKIKYDGLAKALGKDEPCHWEVYAIPGGGDLSTQELEECVRSINGCLLQLQNHLYESRKKDIAVRREIENIIEKPKEE